MQGGEVGFAATALNHMLIGARVADFLFGGGDATVNLVDRISTAAREAAAKLGVIAHADEDRDERSGEARVGGALSTNRGGALDVHVQQGIKASAEVRGDVGRPRSVKIAVHGSMLEEDAGGDLLFEAGARQEVVIDAIRLAGAGGARRTGNHAADGLRVGLGQPRAERGLTAASRPRDDDEQSAAHARRKDWATHAASRMLSPPKKLRRPLVARTQSHWRQNTGGEQAHQKPKSTSTP